jgi:hypothetical protein
VGRETDWPCVVSIATGGVLLWGVAAVMLRRGAALSPGLTGALAAIAALSVANLEACISRPHAFAITIVLWHGAATAIMLLVLAGAGRRVFVWPRTAR